MGIPIIESSVSCNLCCSKISRQLTEKMSVYHGQLLFVSCLYLGLEWRLITAGENKVRMDPFKPLKQADVDHTAKILHSVHNNFIQLVKERRPNLDPNHKSAFSGDFFIGKDAVSMGLADGFCSDLKALCMERFGKDVKFERCEPPKGFLDRFQGVGSNARIELSVGELLDELTDKQQEAKFGL